MCDLKEHDLICPITKQIYKRPVTAVDGFIYEEDAINNWFKKSKCSPITTEEINTCVIPNIDKQNKVYEYIQHNPIKLFEQYQYEISSFEQFKNLKIKNLTILSRNNLENISKLLSVDDLNFMIQNCEYDANLENNYRLIHFICMHSHEDVVLHIINHYINNNLCITCKTTSGWSPIYYILKHCSSKLAHIMIDYYEKHNLSLDRCKEDQWSLLHICARCQQPDVIIRMIDIYHKNGYDMNTFDFYGYTVLHYVCKYSTREVINYLINKNVYLTIVSPISNNKNFINMLNENKKLKI